MARPGDVIAQHLEGAFTDEEAAGVGDFVHVLRWILGGNTGVFGGKITGQLARFIQIIGDDDAALPIERDGDGVGAAEAFHLAGYFHLDGFGQLA